MTGLLLMVTTGFALGAPHSGGPVFDAICIAISGGAFPAKKLCLGREFLAWANLGIHSIVVGRMVRLESNNVVNVSLAGRGQFLVLP
eukprot:11341097-Ditylum_brightwellii.AAC.1